MHISCETCLHYKIPAGDMPCIRCWSYSRWEYMDYDFILESKYGKKQ